MKRRKVALFSIVASLLFLVACATPGYGPGATKSARLTVPDCLE